MCRWSHMSCTGSTFRISCQDGDIHNWQGDFFCFINTLIYSFHHTEPLPAIENEPSSFAEDWLAAFKAQEQTEVILVLASGTEMRAHKIVLCAASSFLANMINPDSRSEVKLSMLPLSSLSLKYDHHWLKSCLPALHFILLKESPYIFSLLSVAVRPLWWGVLQRTRIFQCF